MWENGYDEGTKAARTEREIPERRDKAEELLVAADNALVKSDWAKAARLLDEAAHNLRWVSSNCQFMAKTIPQP
jgi:hypothetical protein